ncbi:MAG TPA: endonuclease MutS2, partial [Candidatus Ligilactobacillus excrementipullorum]|nr:endonuclease MutS2 [Candidatus Ligilactobacillus excrementipullorum]
MNEKSLITLEYFKIKQQARQYLVTDLGQRELADLRPMITSSEIRQALNETKDAVDILWLKGGIPLPQIEDVKPFLKRLDIGATLNAKELAAVGKILRATNEVRRFFRGMQDDELDLS